MTSLWLLKDMNSNVYTDMICKFFYFILFFNFSVFNLVITVFLNAVTFSSLSLLLLSLLLTSFSVFFLIDDFNTHSKNKLTVVKEEVNFLNLVKDILRESETRKKKKEKTKKTEKTENVVRYVSEAEKWAERKTEASWARILNLISVKMMCHHYSEYLSLTSLSLLCFLHAVFAFLQQWLTMCVFSHELLSLILTKIFSWGSCAAHWVCITFITDLALSSLLTQHYILCWLCIIIFINLASGPLLLRKVSVKIVSFLIEKRTILKLTSQLLQALELWHKLHSDILKFIVILASSVSAIVVYSYQNEMSVIISL